MHVMRIWVVLGLALLAATPLRADDACSADEHRTADATMSRAQAAENSGDLVKALQLVNSSEVRGCGEQKTSEAMLASSQGVLTIVVIRGFKNEI